MNAELFNRLIQMFVFPFRFLGHLYAAEALINMDHIFDAIQHLSPDTVMDVSVLPPQEPGQGKSFI